MNKESNKEVLAIIRFLAGPMAGKEFPVNKSTISLGRSKESDLVIADTLLSRRHVLVSYKNKQWFVEDLKSSNGTWISGRELKEPVEIENYQRIRAGNSLFEVEFCNQNHETDLSISYSFKPVPINEDTNNLPIESIRLQHRRLAVMYKMQNQLSLILNEKEIYSCIGSVLLNEIPADYIYIMLYDQKKDSFLPAFGRSLKGSGITLTKYPISSSVLKYVKQKGEAILSYDPPNDIRFAADSVTILKTQKVICVPIIYQQELIGAIYMAIIESNKNFSEEDLQLLAGIGFSSAMAIMNCRLVKKNIANERMAALGTTAASLSHYIKNILTGIDGCLYLMRMGIDESDNDLSNEAWGILSRNHKRLSGLVMDLLNLAKEHNLNLQMANVCEIIIEAVELVRHTLANLNIEVEIGKFLGNENLTAEVDSQGIHRVILNLLNNASDAVFEKFNSQPGGKIKIDATVLDNQRVIEIRVEDNGIGIPADKMEQIFDMFYTGKGDRGTGLGLAVSRRLVEAHKGAIGVASEVGKFSIFTVRLPLAQRNVETQLFKRPTLE